jgi:hypothetical protein
MRSTTAAGRVLALGLMVVFSLALAGQGCAMKEMEAGKKKTKIVTEKEALKTEDIIMTGGGPGPKRDRGN